MTSNQSLSGQQRRTLWLAPLLLVCWPLFNANAGEDDPGIIYYPPEGAELPVVREGTPFRADIPIHNPYNRAVRITRKDSTCVCNVLETKSDFLIPGEQTTLAFEVANERISGIASQIVWLYLSDPDYEPLEVRIRWRVTPMIAVDALPPDHRGVERPEDVLWRDIYRLESIERPEDARNLQKNLLLTTIPEEMPEGGLEILGIEYEGSLWSFTTRRIDKLRSLVLLRAADPEAVMPQGVFEETFVIRTNHPDKAAIEMELGTKVDPDAGRPADNPLLNPPGMPIQ